MGEDEKSVKRFSGVPETYYRETWREWAKGYLFGLPDTVSPTKYGVRLKNLLDGEAADIVRHLVVGASKAEDELGEPESELKIFELLDKRWKDKRPEAKEKEVMDKFVKNRWKPGEQGDAFTGRTRTMFSELERYGDYKVPSRMRGQLTYRMFGLTDEDRATFMALSKDKDGKSTWDFEAVCEAIEIDKATSCLGYLYM